MEGWSILGRLWRALTTLEAEWGLSFFVFVVEIAVLVIGIPAYLRWREQRKWAPMRQSYPFLFWTYRDRVIDVMQELAGLKRGEDTKPAIERTRSAMERARQDLHLRLILLNPAITAEISAHVDSAVQAMDTMHEQVFACIDQPYLPILEQEELAAAGGYSIALDEVNALAQVVGVEKKTHLIMAGLLTDEEIEDDSLVREIDLEERLSRSRNGEGFGKLLDRLLKRIGQKS